MGKLDGGHVLAINVLVAIIMYPFLMFLSGTNESLQNIPGIFPILIVLQSIISWGLAIFAESRN